MALTAEDRMDIQDLHARYAWALDTGDAKGVAALFAPDGVMEGSDGTVQKGRATIQAYCQGAAERPAFRGTQHHVGHAQIEGDGTKASARLYWNTLRADQATGVTGVGRLGYYADQYVKLDGQWYFAKRHINWWQEGTIPWVGPKLALPGEALTMASITGMTVDDRQAVHELFARYAWACNTGDEPLLLDSFTEDAVIINPSQVREDGHDGLRAFAKFMFNRPEFAGRQHYVGQLVMRGGAERCEVKSYCYVHEWIRGTDIRQLYRLFMYEDVCVKKDGRWYFAHRHIKPWDERFLPWVGPKA